MERNKGRKVVCAMSGGVDSSVAAALLKKEGFDVVGVFMKFWSDEDHSAKDCDYNRCCSPESERRAREVASILEIPFYVLNFKNEFKKRVVDYFLKTYKKGSTPNPCVVCNKEIKFGMLLEKAIKLQADFIATGHYARIKRKKNEVSLLRSQDRNKDQSYFLWTLSQKQLEKVLFPIGNYLRSEVEKMAEKLKLPFEGVKKSQEVCFVPKTLEEFLSKYLKNKAGEIVDRKGKTVGRHSGLWFYTLGQRKRIGLSGGPYYAIDKDFRRNRLIVSSNEKDLLREELVFTEVNWISGKEPDLPLEVKAKIRYRSQSASAVINKDQKHKVYSLRFKVAQRAVTPGQSVVFYKGEELLGGGIIL
ncbi:MAG: tRNA 2-thiouridine(34) synthase MnmA [Candidatus Pacebacteria bacterium]|nr:tRNA 2-thiouridine(34) synthase MnmA [Candidatus Paceibacterota bacterium]